LISGIAKVGIAKKAFDAFQNWRRKRRRR